MIPHRKIIPVIVAILLAVGVGGFPSLSVAAGDISGSEPGGLPDALRDPEIRQFIDEMVTRHGYPRESLETLLGTVRFMPELLKRLSKPAEALPWYKYRRIFLKQGRMEEGVRFWRAHRETLARAEKTYGVPAKIIVGILGVETYFGKHKGKYPVLDSLVTLSFSNSKRARFFRGELEQFLLLVNEEKKILDAHRLKGSYAGAMGLPQFISSSYRRYAVDFDGDNRRDLINSVPDAIGSAAHYLAEHGWQRDAGVATPARVDRMEITSDLLMKRTGSPPHVPFSVLKDRGLVTQVDIPGDEKAALIGLEIETGPDYWLGQKNFYVITRYNHSNLYAMAVYQLAEAIRLRYLREEPAQ